MLAIVNPLEQFNKAADSRRKADLGQIQKALESYYQDHGRYPYMYKNGNVSQISTTGTTQGGTSAGVVAWGSDFRPYMDVLPIDQKKAKSYGYWSDPATGQEYALYASLDRGGKDPQACNHGNICTNASVHAIVCGGVCNYGVSSPNIAP